MTAVLLMQLPNFGELQPWQVELIQLSLAALLGGSIGLERQINGHWAGLRTHMAVSMGAAIYVMVASGLAPAPQPDATRVVQGIAAGIGFLGAGTILKLSDKLEVKGLTTASSIWLAAALGTATGLSRFSLAISASVLSLSILFLLRPLEKRFLPKSRHP